MKKINIDGKDYDLSNLTKNARETLDSLQFVQEQLLQRENELQVALTAKIGYSRALEREIAKIS